MQDLINYFIQTNKATLTPEELIRSYDELNAIIKDAKKVLDEKIKPELELLVRDSGEKKILIGNRSVSMIQLPSFKDVTIEFATRKSAIKLVPDADILKKLWKEGEEVVGMTITEFIRVH